MLVIVVVVVLVVAVVVVVVVDELVVGFEEIEQFIPVKPILQIHNLTRYTGESPFLNPLHSLY